MEKKQGDGKIIFMGATLTKKQTKGIGITLFFGLLGVTIGIVVGYRSGNVRLGHICIIIGVTIGCVINIIRIKKD